MADVNDGALDAQQQDTAQQEPNGAEQDLEHWKSMSRKNERAAKDAARERDEAKASLDVIAAELESAKAEIASLKAERAHEDAVRSVAAASGLPEAVVRGLRGETAEELTASAAALKENYSAYPQSRDSGEPTGMAAAGRSTAQMFASVLDGLI